MTLEEQLEFPFLERIRRQSWARAQHLDMKRHYTLAFQNNTNKPPFREYMMLYAESGMAASFRARNHDLFFYDSPSFIKGEKAL